jgi:DNA mismatch endonuclease (patch repair protein)
MVDIVNREARSRMMAGIRAKNTKPEQVLRQFLHRQGFRFRLHDAKLPGKPDMVFPKLRAVLFVHGCFWHRHVGCQASTIPSSNVDFWRSKLASNRRRDKKHIDALLRDGWRVGVVWECVARRGVPHRPTFEAVASWLDRRGAFREFPKRPQLARNKSN